MKLSIRHLNGGLIYEAEAAHALELLNLAIKHSANLTGAYLGDANLKGANLTDANLTGAYLTGAYLTDTTIIETSETWAVYLSEVLPALLTAGGVALAEVLTGEHWNCHSWDNCPMAAAFDTRGLEGVPVLLRPRAEQFIRFFDAKLIPLEAVKAVAA